VFIVSLSLKIKKLSQKGFAFFILVIMIALVITTGTVMVGFTIP
jgi:hypothetical protein